MAKKPGSSPSAMKNRAAKTAAALGSAQGGSVAAAVAAPAAPRKKTSPMQFLREVRAEARKITWTSRRETWITSVMVAIMVVLAAIYFSLVDGILHFAITQVLKLAAGGQ